MREKDGKRKRIAVLFGGCSAEYAVSLQSAAAVLEHMDAERFDIMAVGITREGDWYHYTGGPESVRDDSWRLDRSKLHPVTVSVSRSMRGFLERQENGSRRIAVDLVFPILHGKNGEDGTLQGMFELAGIPVVGCRTLSSALCMDKDRAHKLAALAGIAVPPSVAFGRPEKEEALRQIAEQLNYPLFVKPVRAGSSIGITRVGGADALEAAIDLAFTYDEEVIVEERVEGFEVGCAILGCETLLAGRVDEIELAGGFFDYREKYGPEASRIHMPARFDAREEKRIQETAMAIYRALGCSGLARVDMFYTPSGEIVFNEVNTIPGFTAHSRYPNMMKGIGLSFSQMLEKLLDLYEEEPYEHQKKNR
ncbi:MAG: D-alanine--D-serine ligase VanG [Blautia sp.]|nr:D-alanine--D-serine ligase VanG [Blautia sp.]